MKKDKDFWEENAFLSEKEPEDLSLIPLPEDYSAEKSQRKKTGIARTICVCLIAFALAASLFCAVVLFLPNETVEYIDADSESLTEEWRGVFFSRGIYEDCVSCAVSVSAGAVKRSGVIIDADGWIVTASDIIDAEGKGRISVLLGDGRECEVQCLKTNEEIGVTYCKISARELSAAELSFEKLHSGERLTAVNGNGDVIDCSVANVRDGKIKINADVRAESSGAPLFDENGKLVALILVNKESDLYPFAIAAEDLKNGILKEK